MRMSELVGRRIKEDPKDAKTASHRYLVRGGYIRPVSAGIYSMLPLGKRILTKVERIIRDEMDAVGGQEVLMPVVLLDKPRKREWRGQINPDDWNDWWEDYENLVMHYAWQAEAHQVEMFMIGSELLSTESNDARWRALIQRVRGAYHGKVCYSANWDHFRPIEFWDQLDFIGLTSYFTLADRRNPTVEEIVARWEPIRRDVLAWQRRIGKPILFTEVGWCSQEGAATAPWNYYQNQVATPAGHEEQRRLYEAFLQVWGATPELTGIIWWEWTPGPGGPDDFGYSPRNKPAEQVLRRWFAAGPTTGPATQPAP